MNKVLYLSHFQFQVIKDEIFFLLYKLFAVTWLMLSEIFPGSLRGRAFSVATCINWGANIVVSLTFLDVLSKFFILF